MSTFVFRNVEHGYKVYYRGHLIGDILPIQEASGRPGFYLGCDNRREPRLYRGQVRAAEALAGSVATAT